MIPRSSFCSIERRLRNSSDIYTRNGCLYFIISIKPCNLFSDIGNSCEIFSPKRDLEFSIIFLYKNPIENIHNFFVRIFSSYQRGDSVFLKRYFLSVFRFRIYIAKGLEFHIRIMNFEFFDNERRSCFTNRSDKIFFKYIERISPNSQSFTSLSNNSMVEPGRFNDNICGCITYSRVNSSYDSSKSYNSGVISYNNICLFECIYFSIEGMKYLFTFCISNMNISDKLISIKTVCWLPVEIKRIVGNINEKSFCFYVVRYQNIFYIAR